MYHSYNYFYLITYKRAMHNNNNNSNNNSNDNNNNNNNINNNNNNDNNNNVNGLKLCTCIYQQRGLIIDIFFYSKHLLIYKKFHPLISQNIRLFIVKHDIFIHYL